MSDTSEAIDVNAAEHAAEDVVATTRKPKSPMGRIDAAAGSVTYPGEAYHGAGLPSVARSYLIALGLRVHMQGVADRGTAYEALNRGEVPAGRPTPAAKALPPLRQAISQALMERGRKSGNQPSLEHCEDVARKMQRGDAEAFRTDPLVAKHLAKLVPPPSLDALLPGAAAVDQAA